MNGFRAKLDYILKHNVAFYTVFEFVMSMAFRIIGIFVKVDKKAIIFSGHGRKYNDSPKAIYEYMISHQDEFKDYKYYWALEEPEKAVIPGNCIKIKTDTIPYFLKTLSCKYWVTCVNIERGLRYKSKKNIYLNTWHGTPIKSIDNNGTTRKKDDFSYMDFFCVSGEYEKECFKKAFCLKDSQLVYSGLPRNDVLYNVTENDVLKVKEKLGLPVDKKIILYAPTWRDSKDKGKTYIAKPPINIEKWKKELGDTGIVLMRTHPYTNKLLGISFDDFVIDYTAYPNINDLMIASDILISDYSAAIFDYSILEKPIVCFAYDYEEYKSERGLALNMEKEIPGGVLRTEDEVLSAIKNMNYQDACARTKAFKEKYLEFGGNATKICLEKLFSK